MDFAQINVSIVQSHLAYLTTSSLCQRGFPYEFNMGIVLAFSRSETAAKQREDAQQVSTKKGVDVTLECVSNMQSGLMIDGFLGARMEFKERQWSSTYMTHGRCGCQYSMVPELGSFSSVLGSSPTDAGRCSRIVGARSDRESRTSLQELPNLK